MNPYWGASFFSFFPIFFTRLFQLLTGRLSFDALAADEIQVFVLVCISISSALIGTLLVLRRMTMLANSLSHTILLGIVIAYIVLFAKAGEQMEINFSVMVIAALATGLLTAFFTQLLHHVFRLQEDASIGLVFSSLFALGIVLVTLYTRNAHIGLEVVMGNPDGLRLEDIKIGAFTMALSLSLILLFYKEWKLICFDPGLATSLGRNPHLFTYLLMLFTSIVAISAFRAVGVLLFLAFLVGLPLTARLLTRHFHTMLILGSGLGVLCSTFAVAYSRHLLSVYNMPLSTAGLVVCFIGGFFVLAITVKSLNFKKAFK